jgi:hypothetical protein
MPRLNASTALAKLTRLYGKTMKAVPSGIADVMIEGGMDTTLTRPIHSDCFAGASSTAIIAFAFEEGFIFPATMQGTSI